MSQFDLLTGKLLHIRISLQKSPWVFFFGCNHIDIQNSFLFGAKLIVVSKVHLNNPGDFLYFFLIDRHQICLIKSCNPQLILYAESIPGEKFSSILLAANQIAADHRDRFLSHQLITRLKQKIHHFFVGKAFRKYRNDLLRQRFCQDFLFPGPV